MAIYEIGYIYKDTDFNPDRVNLETGTFGLESSATPMTAYVQDDDGVLEDNNNVGGQTLDTSQQVLSSAFLTHPAGTSIYSRATYSVTVTYPDGSVHTGEANQLVVGGVRYTAFQFVVPPGSTVNFNSVDPIGNTPYGDFACFTAGTLIETAEGARPVETLRVGDLVRTADRGLQEIRMIMSRSFDADELRASPNLYPVRISAGALGQGLPRCDLLVSPQHRMMLRSDIVRKMIGCDEVLIPAKKLLAQAGIDIVADLPEVTYVHFLCSRHEVVFAEGAPSESFYPGPQAMKSMTAEVQRELLTIFPALAGYVRDGVTTHLPIPAREIVRGPAQKSMVARHVRKATEFLQAN